MEAAPRTHSNLGLRESKGCEKSAGSPASLQEKSAGTIKVATCPGGPPAARTAEAVSAPMSWGRWRVRTQPETGRANLIQTLKPEVWEDFTEEWPNG
jgi:hypothetical protein